MSWCLINVSGFAPGANVNAWKCVGIWSLNRLVPPHVAIEDLQFVSGYVALAAFAGTIKLVPYHLAKSGNSFEHQV